MIQLAWFFLLVFFGVTLSAQTINVRGKVSDKAGKPVSNAIVELLRRGLKDTTGADGSFSLAGGTGVSMAPLLPNSENVSLCGGVLELMLCKPSAVKVDIYDVKGTLLMRALAGTMGAGEYRLNVAEKTRSTGMQVVHVSIGTRSTTFQYLPVGNGKSVMSAIERPLSRTSGGLAKIAADVDTVRVTASGYQIKTMPIVTYDTTVNITLDSSTTNGKNPPGPSSGCGKLSTILTKTGTYQITSGSSQRKYIIDIPENYDKNKPYKLFFCFHWIDSKADDVANGVIANGGAANWGYYGLKRMATSAGEQCIFVAPQALPGNPKGTWSSTSNVDIVFVQDMLKLFKGELCIDTTRVFATGFSFGGMMSVSCSFSIPKLFRAIVPLAGVAYRIYMPPTPSTEPIAYMHVVGMGDNTCPYNTNDKGGKWCVTTHATNNGCTVPAVIPTVAQGSSTHLAYEFQGCRDGYPVRLCTFNGGHVAGNVDGQTAEDGLKSWIPTESWNFFSRF